MWLSLELLGSSWQTVWEVGKVRGCGMDGLNYFQGLFNITFVCIWDKGILRSCDFICIQRQVKHICSTLLLRNSSMFKKTFLCMTSNLSWGTALKFLSNHLSQASSNQLGITCALPQSIASLNKDKELRINL